MRSWNDPPKRGWWPTAPRPKKAPVDAPQLRIALERLQRQHAACIDRLREVDHRAKNTLQLAGALLKLEARNAPPECREHLESAASRLYAMAQLERHLSNSGTAACRMRDCLQPVADIYDGMGGASVELEVEDLACPAELITPLTLIANEAVTNAVKHHMRAGAPHIRLCAHLDGGAIEVCIRDEGGGFPDGTKLDGFGLKVMRTLTRQIAGEFAITSESGVGSEVRVRFQAATPTG